MVVEHQLAEELIMVQEALVEVVKVVLDLLVEQTVVTQHFSIIVLHTLLVAVVVVVVLVDLLDLEPLVIMVDLAVVLEEVILFQLGGLGVLIQHIHLMDILENYPSVIWVLLLQ